MKIFGIKVGEEKEYLNEDMKRFFTRGNLNIFKYFKRISLNDSTVTNDTIYASRFRPNRFADSKQCVTFNHEGDIPHNAYCMGGIYLDKKFTPDIRFRIKDSLNNYHWLADFYKKNNFIITSSAISNGSNHVYYDKIFGFLKENSLIKIIPPSITNELKVDFKILADAELYIDNEKANILEATRYDEETNQYVYEDGSEEVFNSLNIGLDEGHVEDKNIIFGSSTTGNVIIKTHRSDSIETLIEKITEMFSKCGSGEFKLNHGYLKVCMFPKNYSIQGTSDLTILLSYFILYRVRGLAGSRGLSSMYHNVRGIVLPNIFMYNKKIVKIVLNIFKSILLKYHNGVTIEINGNCSYCNSKEEYASQLGIDIDDAKYFLDFNKSINSLYKLNSSKDIKQRWLDDNNTIETTKEKTIDISFNSKDKFSSKNLRIIPDLIKTMNKTTIKRNCRVVFYGLKKSRGNDKVSGISASGYTTIEAQEKYVDTSKTLYIGLPYELRIEEGYFDTRILTGIKNKINERVL